MKATQVLILLLAFIAATHVRRDMLRHKKALAVEKPQAVINLTDNANSNPTVTPYLAVFKPGGKMPPATFSYYRERQ